MAVLGWNELKAVLGSPALRLGARAALAFLRALYVELDVDAPAGGRESRAHRRIIEQRANGRGDRLRRLHVHGQRGTRVRKLGGCPSIGGEHRNTARHRFQYHVAKGLSGRGAHEQVGTGVHTTQRLPVKAPRKVRALRGDRSQLLERRTVTGDHKT
jgi:hypothetical protein